MSDILTTSQVARILGISSSRVIQLANATILRADRINGGMRIFHRSHVEKLSMEREAKRTRLEAGRAVK